MNRRDMLVVSLALACSGVPHAPADEGDDEAKAIAKIKEIGALVLEIAQNDNRLDVSYITAQTKVVDEHLAPLKDLRRLAHLNLRGTDITDAGLTAIASRKGLVRLHLEKTKITDKGLEPLKGLENLEYLNLYGTEITDVGLAHLEGLKKLKSLYLWQTKVTDDGVKRLQEAIPGLKIIRGA
ncbi:MAG: leucine-rich repeat domain-containing protein [Planctomycetaceae bacterium]